VERLARSDRKHARASDAFDADPWVFNTPAGVVDLRTGRMRAHRPGDLFTKVSAVGPGRPNARDGWPSSMKSPAVMPRSWITCIGGAATA
jgi:phage/plasmid-associated DNA primase